MSNQTHEQEVSGVNLGRYQIFAKLATGGMAELYLAKQQGLAGISKTVVLKCVLPHLAESEEFVTMFLDEARVATHLNHQNIVQLYDVGQFNNIYYIAMEYIRGPNLNKLQNTLENKGLYEKNVPYGLFAGLIQQAAAGLDYAHNATDDMGQPLHIIHRDVSPNNLLVSDTGVLKIVDFGVAKAQTQEHHTRVGTLKGRLSYMSPEHLSGQPISARADVFSLGVVLFELIANQRLFKRQTEGETVQAVLADPIPSLKDLSPNCPDELNHIVLKSLAREPDDRYQSAAEMARALGDFLHGSERWGPPQIAAYFKSHLDNDFAETTTGLMKSPFNQKDLMLIAYRTGSFGNFSSPPTPNPSHSQSFSQAPQGNDWLESSAPSFSGMHYSSSSNPSVLRHTTSGFITPSSDELDLPPAKSKAGLWVFLLLLLGLGGAAWSQQDRIKQWMGAKDTSETSDDSFVQKRRAWIKKHNEILKKWLDQKDYEQAITALQGIREQAPRSYKLQRWLDLKEEKIKNLARMANIEFMMHHKNYDAAKKIVEKILLQNPERTNLRKLLSEISKKQEAARTLALKPKTEVREPAPPPKRRRRRRRSRRKKKKKRVAMEPRRVEPVLPRIPTPPKPKYGLAYINSTPPARAELDGKLIGYTPINGKKVLVGKYVLRLRAKGFVTATRNIEIEGAKLLEITVKMNSLTPAPVRVPEPRRAKVVEVQPKVEDSSKPRYSFSRVRLPRHQSIRLLVSDRRGIVGRMYTSSHKNLAEKIEREVARLLGPGFSAKGITKPWQLYVRRTALKRGQRKLKFYPRAVAYVIYRNLSRKRSKNRVMQLLVAYQKKRKFRRYKNR